jgi:hypothetical protein
VVAAKLTKAKMRSARGITQNQDCTLDGLAARPRLPGF